MPKKYIVSLSSEQRQILEKVITTGKSPAYKINHARILLKADTNQTGGAWRDQDISQALDTSISTIERVRRRFVEGNLETALSRKPQQHRKAHRLDDEQSARLIDLIRSPVPAGHTRWTLRLLAAHMVQLGYVESISHETIRQALKKTNVNLN
ncbi:MAG: helix-turn-helix domain-containing protein [Cyanothece sp. SIO1E1]|nr:helix-turn-helix domain-containing protein [Cyanothece sp. SIO1E1]